VVSPAFIFSALGIGFFARIPCSWMSRNQRPMNPEHFLYKIHTELSTEGNRTRRSTV
jgi:hypothetical protein